MIAWEWTLDKARDGDDEKTEKTARKISQTAQVREDRDNKGVEKYIEILTKILHTAVSKTLNKVL